MSGYVQSHFVIFLFSILPTLVFSSSFITQFGDRTLQNFGRGVAVVSFSGSMLIFGLVLKEHGFFEDTIDLLRSPRRALNHVLAHVEPGERFWFVWSTIGIGVLCIFPAVVCSNNLAFEVSQMQPSIWKNAFTTVVIPLVLQLQDKDGMLRSVLRGEPSVYFAGRKMLFAFWILFNVGPLLVFISWTTGGSFTFRLGAWEIFSLHGTLFTLWVVLKGEWYGLKAGISTFAV